MSNSLQISVIICTHNREHYLPKAIRSLIVQTLPKEAFEIVVVDNASTDGTKAIVCEQFEDVPNLRYVYEPEMGLAFARNAGWRNAQGEIIAYLDDDAVASPGWLEAILNVYRSVEPAPGCVGGPVTGIWEGERPVWLSDRLARWQGVVKWSDEPHFLTPLEWMPGCNMACPRRIVESLNGFWAYLDRKGRNLLSNGDILLQKQVANMGHPSYYAPGVAVQHHVQAGRLTQAWYVKRAYWQGVSDVVMQRHLRKETGDAPAHTIGGAFRELLTRRRLAGLLLPAKEFGRMEEKVLAWVEVGRIAELLRHG
jgi:glycosyltransferase involved in cell wall biosynthesis